MTKIFKSQFAFMFASAVLTLVAVDAMAQTNEVHNHEGKGWWPWQPATSIEHVCKMSELSALEKAMKKCKFPNKVRDFTCKTNSSGVGPAFPPPMLYYWCDVTCSFSCKSDEQVAFEELLDLLGDEGPGSDVANSPLYEIDSSDSKRE